MLEHFYHNLELPTSFIDRPFVALNMVSSLDGKVTLGGNLKPGSLGSSFDRYTMNILRSHFDGVLAGGSTIRHHPYYLGVPAELELEREKRGLASQPLTILLTKSGNLNSQSPLFSEPPRPPLIFTSLEGKNTMHSSITKQARVEVLADPTNLGNTLSLLQNKYGVKRLLLEGGPNLNFQFLEAKLVDHLFITLAPKLVGNSEDFTMAMGDRVLPQAKQIRLLASQQHDQELYLHYQITWD